MLKFEDQEWLNIRYRGFSSVHNFIVQHKRTDGYGGALQNRVRIIAEIIPQIRGVVGEDFIISVRMGGNIPDVVGAAEVARALEKAGIDLLHISFGMKMPANTVPAGFNGSVIAYNGSEIKKQVHIPVIGVWEISTYRLTAQKPRVCGRGRLTPTLQSGSGN